MLLFVQIHIQEMFAVFQWQRNTHSGRQDVVVGAAFGSILAENYITYKNSKTDFSRDKYKLFFVARLSYTLQEET